MVKIKYLKIIYVILSIAILIYIPFKENENYYVNEYRMYISMADSNTIHIVENIVYNPKKAPNGITKTINLGSKDAKVENISVCELYPVKSDLYFDVLNDKSTFDFRIYNKVDDMDKSQIIKIEYDIRNAVQKNDGFYSLDLKILDKEDYLKFKKGQVCVFYPDNYSEEDIDVFLNANGMQKKIENTNNTSYVLKNLSYDYGIDLNVLIKNKKFTHSVKYDEIKNKNIEKQAVEMRRNKYTLYYNLLANVQLICLILIFLIKKIKVILTKAYLPRSNYNKIPTQCTPAIQGYLLNEKVVSYSIVWTILDLHRRGYILIKECIDDYTIEVLKEDEYLKSHEIYFLKWMFYSSNEKSISFKNLYESNKNKSNFNRFKSNFIVWSNKIIEDAYRCGYINKKRKTILYISIIINICLLFVSIILSKNAHYFLYLASIFIIFYNYCFNKTSVKGKIVVKRFKRFKKYILNLKNIKFFKDRKENITAYIIYCMPLKIERNLHFKFKDIIDEQLKKTYYNSDFLRLTEKAFKLKKL